MIVFFLLKNRKNIKNEVKIQSLTKSFGQNDRNDETDSLGNKTSHEKQKIINKHIKNLNRTSEKNLKKAPMREILTLSLYCV